MLGKKRRRKKKTKLRAGELVCQEAQKYKQEAREATNALVVAFEKKQLAS